MSDRDLVEKRLAHVVDAVELLRRHADLGAVEHDPVQRGFVQHTLQTAIQGMLDAAATIVSAKRLGEPASNAGLFDHLASAGWIAVGRAATYRKLVAFRNILVHQYLVVDPRVVRAVVEHHLDDLLGFVREVRSKLPEL